MDSGAPLPSFFLGRAYEKLRGHRKGIAALTNAVRLGDHVPIFESSFGYAYARAGQRSKAEQILDGFKGMQRKALVAPIDLALVRLGLGDTEAALNALEETRSPRMINLNDPFFSELALEPRYQRLLAGLRLPSKPY